MPAESAERRLRTGHPRLWVAGLLLCALAVAAWLVLDDGDTEISVPQPAPSDQAEPVSTRADSASELLSELTSAVTTGTRHDAMELAPPGDKPAARRLAAIYDNARALRVTELSFRYVDEDADQPGWSDTELDQPAVWAADVDVTWRLRGFDEAVSEMEVAFLFADSPHGTALLDVGGDSQPAPLWLLDRLAVQRSKRTLVMAADPSVEQRFANLAHEAVADVSLVLPRWRDRLVIEVPRSEDQLTQLLGASEGTYDAIAAVTSTVDGSTDGTAPAHVFINPKVFDSLGREGSQIVISHEATHVATEAATSSMTMWLLEGFADYVALAHVDLPVSVTASQILDQVSEEGPPSNLPSAEDFEPSSPALGATYESAWLACKLIADRYGEKTLVELYRTVEGGASLDEAFRSVTGDGLHSFTDAWRGYLRELAG